MVVSGVGSLSTDMESSGFFSDIGRGSNAVVARRLNFRLHWGSNAAVARRLNFRLHNSKLVLKNQRSWHIPRI
jgi:hypothetical protein